MSSLLIFQQSSAVHLITDGATYDSEGIIRKLGSKVVSLPLANCVIALRGATWARDPLAAMLGLAGSLDDIIDLLPDAMAGLVRLHELQNPANTDWRFRNFEVTVAGWSERAQAWSACLASTWDAADPNDPIGWSELDFYQPYQPFFTTPFVAHPATDIACVLGHSVETRADLEALDVRRDGLALHHAQRMEPGVFLGEPRYLVGGFSELVTVSAAGIERQILQEWPDTVGEMIAPEGAPSLQHWRERIELHLAA